MKKLLLTICAISFAMLVHAQGHMSFKGVSMGRDLTSFVAELTAKGYNKELLQDNGAVLSGGFAGKDDCTIVVLCTSHSKLVWKVMVRFPKRTSWSSLKSEYNSFKESYTEKYGSPKSYEFFTNPYYEGDGYELQALELEKCTYASFFSTPQGHICLEISKKKDVVVSYEDEINTNIKSVEKNKVVSNDI